MNIKAIRKTAPEIEEVLIAIHELDVTPIAELTSRNISETTINYRLGPDGGWSDHESQQVRQHLIDKVAYIKPDNTKVVERRNLFDQNRTGDHVTVRVDINNVRYDMDIGQTVGDWERIEWDDDIPDRMLLHTDAGILCGLTSLMHMWSVDVWDSDGDIIHSVELDEQPRAEAVAGVWTARYPHKINLL